MHADGICVHWRESAFICVGILAFAMSTANGRRSVNPFGATGVSHRS
jgi:hypothetical protein